jgi:hypothetical protein
LRKIIRHKREELTATLEEFTISSFLLYSSPNIIRFIDSRRSRLAGHVARVGKRKSTYRALVGKPEEKTWKARKWIGG